MYRKTGKKINLFIAAAVALLTSGIPAMSQTYYDGVRIGWDFSQESYINSGVYARVKKMQNGKLAMVYSAGSDVYFVTSADGGYTWDYVRQVAHDSKNIYNYTNSELIQLQNGTLMYAWNARPKDQNNPGGPYKIMAKYSIDNGYTWKNEQNLFIAGTTSNEGCWEPSMLQLPSGELQVYFANEYLVNNDNQNISMMRSFDNGTTWKTPEVVSFRSGSRDGMPVPLILKNGNDLIFAIEDNGLNGNFKPVMIHTSLTDNWSSGTVSGDSPNRWPALSSNEDLASSIYAGAPYLIQLSTGETLLSIQSGEGRLSPNSLDHALMQVYVGNNAAQNFLCKSTPFPFLTNSSANVLWNNLCQINDSTVMAVSSISNLSTNNGIWTVTGHIMKPLQTTELKTGAQKWTNNKPNIFIGGSSQANATIRSMWDADSLYFYFEVKDSKVKVAAAGSDPWDTDGIEIYLDPKEKASSSIVSGLYKILVNVNNVSTSSFSDGSDWKDWAPKITYAVKRAMSQNYTIQVSIPWTEIGGKPAAAEFAAMFKLHNNDGTTTITHENLSGANPDAPQTWMRVKMITAEGTGIKSINKENTPKLLTPQKVRRNQPFSISLDNGSLSKSKIYVYDASSGILLASCQNNTANCMIPALNTKGIIIILAELPNKCTLKKKILVQ